MRAAAQGTADHPGGPLGVFLRMAAIPLAAALALMGQVVLPGPGGYSRSLLPGAALVALALALLIFVLARRRFEDAEEPMGWKRTAPGLRDLPPGLEWTLVALLVLGGLYLRLHRIDSVPWGLNNDEAINALEIKDIMDGRPFATLTQRGLNRETMFHYLGAVASGSVEMEINLLTAMPAVFGLTQKFVNDPLMAMIFPLRSVAIAAGTLTLLALYLFARDRFGWLVALLATAFLAVSPWHLLYSRVGERAVLAPLLAIATIGFFLGALGKGRMPDHVAWGVCLGLGLWSYTSFRAIPVAMVAFALLRLPLGWVAGSAGGSRACRALLIAAGVAAAGLGLLMGVSGLGPGAVLAPGADGPPLLPQANF